MVLQMSHQGEAINLDAFGDAEQGGQTFVRSDDSSPALALELLGLDVEPHSLGNLSSGGLFSSDDLSQSRTNVHLPEKKQK